MINKLMILIAVAFVLTLVLYEKQPEPVQLPSVIETSELPPIPTCKAMLPKCFPDGKMPEVVDKKVLSKP